MKRRIYSCLLACLLYWLFLGGGMPAVRGMANRWYISLLGDDSQDCRNLATPCASLAGVLVKVEFVAGDEILIAGGDYVKPDLITTIDQDVSISGGWNEAFTERASTTILGEMVVTQGSQVALQNLSLNGEWHYGLTNYGQITMEQVNFFSQYRGGFDNNGTADVSNCSFSYNGWAITNTGSMNLSHARVSHNSIGIDNRGVITITHTVISDSAGKLGGNGIYNTGSLALYNSSVIDIGNFYPWIDGGGLYNTGSAILVNSTISDNVNYDGFSNSGAGAGIYNTGKVSLYNTTISYNRARLGGGIFNQGGVVELSNSLVAQNRATEVGNPGMDCAGQVISLGYSLVENLPGCQVQDGTGDLHGSWAGVFPARGSPPVSPLARYGLAVDHGDPTGCKDAYGALLLTDQRGTGRIGHCDMGAYEYDPAQDRFYYLWFSLAGLWLPR